MSCNFNFSATSLALNTSSSDSGSNNLDFRYANQVAINKYSDATSKFIFCALVISEDGESEYTKSASWNGENYYRIDHDNEESTSEQTIAYIGSSNNLRLKDTHH